MALLSKGDWEPAGLDIFAFEKAKSLEIELLRGQAEKREYVKQMI